MIDKLQNVIDPYLFEGSIQRDIDLFEWDCGCLMSVPLAEEESNEIFCDCPRPNNHRNNPKKIIATDYDTNEEYIYITTASSRGLEYTSS